MKKNPVNKFLYLFQCGRELFFRSMTSKPAWPFYYIFGVFFCYYFIISQLTIAQGSRSIKDKPLVTQVIRYDIDDAGEVILVWGVSGWRVVPESHRPPGTVVKGSIMHTPMIHDGKSFVIRIHIKQGTTIDYAFLITKTLIGNPIRVVDTNGQPKKDYHTIAENDALITVKSQVTLPKEVIHEIRYHLPEASEVFFLWGINGWENIPEENRPKDTTIKGKLMYTPMTCENDTFVTKLYLPSGTTIDYVFNLTKSRKGTKIDMWDTNQFSGKDYHTVIGKGGKTEIQAQQHLRKQILARVTDATVLWLGSVFLIGLFVFSIGFIVYRHIAVGENLIDCINRLKNLIWEKRLLFILIFISLLLFSSINTDLYVWGDNAHYIIVGKSIATGQGFRDIIYSDKPLFTFPIPFFPMLLAPIIYFFDYNLLPMKIFVVMIAIGVLYFVYRFFKDILNEIKLFFLLLLVGVSPQIVSFSHQVMTEIPYLFLSLLCLISIKKYSSEDRWLTKISIFSILILAASWLTKSIGISIILASAFYLILDFPSKRKLGLKKASFLITGSVILWIFFNYKILAQNPYLIHLVGSSSPSSIETSELFHELINKANHNFNIYLKIIPETIFYRLFTKPNILFQVLIWIVIGYGFLYCFIKRRTILEYYLICYAPILLVFETLNTGNMRRYLVPIIPLILYYFIQGLKQIALRSSDFLNSNLDYSTNRNPQPAINSAFKVTSIASYVIIGILFCFNLTSTYQASVRKYPSEMFDYYRWDGWNEYRKMALWTKDHTPENSIIMVRRSYTFHFWSRRKVCWYPYEYDGNHWRPFTFKQSNKKHIVRTILTKNANYIAINEYEIKEQKGIIQAVQESPDIFQLVYQDGLNKIYKIVRDSKAS